MTTEICKASLGQFVSERNILALCIASAVGISVGATSTSLSNDIIVPIISFAVRKDISSSYIVLKKGERDHYESYQECKDDKKAICLTYGKFISTLINLLLQVLVIFSLLKIFCYSLGTVKTVVAAIPDTVAKLGTT
jgi:large-conductance mechanosensitive channel